MTSRTFSGSGVQQCFRLIVVLLLMLIGRSELSATNYYWVGGTGNWSDINHWVTTSGGNINHLQVPTAFDDVYFDANSFYDTNQVVTVNAGNYTARNIDWTGALYKPKFTNINGYIFRVFGSMTLISNMVFDYLGAINFESTTAGNIITTSGQVFKNNITFCGIGGQWTLADDLNMTNKSIYLLNGTFNTNNKTINCGTIYSQGADLRSLILGTSILNLRGSFYGNAVNFTFSGANSTFNFLSANAQISTNGGTLNYNFVNFNDSTGTALISTGTTANATFASVVIKSNGKIYGNNTFVNISLLKSIYQLQEGKTQTITGSLITAGACTQSTVIRSTTDSITATIHKTGSPLVVNYVLLKDIVATGSSFTANNSVDLGNNTGWTINASTPLNLYWVGNSGTWDNPAHWSYTSGGAGGACVPSPYDNVFFDANSFTIPSQSVNISSTNVFCQSMTWTGVLNTPELKGIPLSSLNIYGSLTFSPNMTLDYKGLVYFVSSTTGRTITSAGQIFKNNVTFCQANGGWKLLDEFNTGNSTLCFIAGSINTNSKTVKCSSFNSTYTNQRQLILGASEIDIIGASSNAWAFNATNLDFQCGTSVINFISGAAGMSNTTGDTIVFNDVNFTEHSGMTSLSSLNITGKFHSMMVGYNSSIGGNNIYDHLDLEGFLYILSANKTQTILNSMTTAGTCEHYTYMYTNSLGMQATFLKSSGTLNLSYLLLQDINATGGAVFNANTSINLSNNSGWNFTSPPAHDLYWVGGTGNWNESSHWAYTSGGTPGACVPTPFDNVFFDLHSYGTTGQYTEVTCEVIFCNNMTWTGVQYTPEWKGSSCSSLKIFGSLTLSPNMTMNYGGVFYFEALSTGKTITTCGKVIKNNVFLCGAGGGWTMLDNFEDLKAVNMVKGTFNTNGHNLICNNFISSIAGTRNINMNASDIIIKGNAPGSWNVSVTGLTFSGSNSHITLPRPNGGMSNNGSGSIAFHDVVFADTSGTSELSDPNITISFNKVVFNSNGKITGNNTFDTLMFYPAKTYTLEATKTQTIISKLYMFGNGCYPITLKSTVQGVQSKMYKNGGMVSAAYVEMRDQFASGASFYAGNNSVNVSNNTGWVFGVAPGYVFGLPDTAYICPGDSLVLNTNGFVGAVSFEWQDGSTNPTYTVTSTGKYWVEVTYADHCFLVDTITILNNSITTAEAGPDHSICTGGSATLTATGLPGSTYAWSTGDTTAQTTVTPTATYTYVVSVSNVCGIATDYVLVYVNQPPVANAGHDTTTCPGTPITLTAIGQPGYTYLWSNGGTGISTNVSPLTTTTYSVTVTDSAGCGSAIDQVTVFTYGSAWANAGADVSVCQGTTVALVASGPAGSTYQWSNGASGTCNNVTPTTTTTYVVTVTGPGNCGIATDDVTVAVSTFPTVDAGSDTTICPGSAVQLTAIGHNANAYLWSTGQSGKTITVAPSTQTTYTVQASNVCGSATDNVTISMLPTATILSTISDEHCGQHDGAAMLTGAVDYLWENGVSGPYISNLGAGVYNVSVYNGICYSTESIVIATAPGPVADFETTMLSDDIESKTFDFNDKSIGATSWNWDFGDKTSTSGVTAVEHTFLGAGKFNVTLAVKDAYNCTDTAVQVIQIELPSLYFIPNAFTPNADGTNEEFGPIWRDKSVLVKYEFIVYDRWGAQVFYTNNPDQGWNGTSFNGSETAADGVYSWLMTVTEKPEFERQYAGSLTLYR
ncbi:MAG: gliding motility-associated C-terminal domain-containing protein [Bacteroidota bacterium]